MKKSIFILAILLVVSCTKDDCNGNYNEIYNNYQTQINYLHDHPFGGVIDYRKIQFLEAERDKKLSNACK